MTTEGFIYLYAKEDDKRCDDFKIKSVLICLAQNHRVLNNLVLSCLALMMQGIDSKFTI